MVSETDRLIRCPVCGDLVSPDYGCWKHATRTCTLTHEYPLNTEAYTQFKSTLSEEDVPAIRVRHGEVKRKMPKMIHAICSHCGGDTFAAHWPPRWVQAPRSMADPTDGEDGDKRVWLCPWCYEQLTQEDK